MGPSIEDTASLRAGLTDLPTSNTNSPAVSPVGDWQALILRYFGDQAGKRLMSVADSIDTRTAAGRMVLNVMMTMAQWERETIVERTRGAMAFKRSRGERVGAVPFGFDVAADGRQLEPNPTDPEYWLARIAQRAAHREKTLKRRPPSQSVVG
jgi:site-specific DNA recombinase